MIFNWSQLKTQPSDCVVLDSDALILNQLFYFPRRLLVFLSQASPYELYCTLCCDAV
jgi:hypothetical protein